MQFREKIIIWCDWIQSHISIQCQDCISETMFTNKHVIDRKCSPAAETRCTDHNTMLFYGVCPGGLPYAVRGLQEAQRRRVHAGGGGTERSSTGSAGQRGAIDGCLQPSGDGDESHRSHCSWRPVGDDCTVQCSHPDPDPHPDPSLFTFHYHLLEFPFIQDDFRLWHTDHPSHNIFS